MGNIEKTHSGMLRVDTRGPVGAESPSTTCWRDINKGKYVRISLYFTVNWNNLPNNFT